MSSSSKSRPDFNFQHTFAPFAQDADLPFADLLTPLDVEQVCADEGIAFGATPRSFWTPAITLAAFLRQALDPDASCRQAVAHLVLSLALSCEPDHLDLNTGNYCRARAKWTAPALERLTVMLGAGLEAAAPKEWRWQNRCVKLVDGSTSHLPDTPENQQAFPQTKRQKPGIGLPLIRWVALIGLATAAVEGFAYGRYTGKETGESALFRDLLEGLTRGDVVLADRYYCSYFMVALLQTHGVDVVMRLHQRRAYDCQAGKLLGPGDHVVVWQKPARPEWMSAELYELLPDQLKMREVHHRVRRAGYRVSELVIATTLLDAREYGADEIAALYEKRWTVELDIRTLKVTLKMDDLRCKTPAMVAKEIWAHLLAYNLVRKVAAQVAALEGVTAREISFTATKQAILGGWQQALQLQGEPLQRASKALLQVVRKQKVGHRPGRCEPRAVKKRPKAQKLLMEPRQEARAKLLKGEIPKKQKRGKKK
jgi:putative transposase